MDRETEQAVGPDEKSINQTGTHLTGVQIGELGRQYVLVNWGLKPKKLQADWEAYSLAPADYPVFVRKKLLGWLKRQNLHTSIEHFIRQ